MTIRFTHPVASYKNLTLVFHFQGWRTRVTTSSQRGIECGEIVEKDLSVRVHRCDHCDLVLDRDVNAARNILALGLSVQGVT